MKKKDIFNGFTLLVAMACLVTFALNMFNGRFLLCDFKVYYSAASNLFAGEPVYRISFYAGSGFYKYSPSTLFLFLPYLAFSYKTAAIIHFFVLGIACWYSFFVIRKLILNYFFPKKIEHELWLVAIAFVCILIHFTRELYLGNINILLLLACCLALQYFLTARDLKGGILMGIVILTKPYLVILLLPLVLRKKRRALAWVILSIMVGLLLPFVFPGPLKGLWLYSGWMKSLFLHNKNFPGMTSLDYFINLVVPSWPAWGFLLIFLSIFSLVTAFIVCNIRREKKEGMPPRTGYMNFTFEWFLLIAILPNLIKTDWVLLLFSAPLIAFMVFNISSAKQYGYIPILFILFFFYGAISDDLLGRTLSQSILQSGLTGLSNFFLVLLSLYMFIHLRKSSA